MIVNRSAEKDYSLFEKPGIDIIGSLAIGGFFNDSGNEKLVI